MITSVKHMDGLGLEKEETYLGLHSEYQTPEKEGRSSSPTPHTAALP